MSFWNGLDARERLLITIAGILLGVLALWFLGIRPVINAKADAKTAQTTALRDLEIVKSGLPKLGGGTASTGTQAFDRNAVIRTAESAGLNLSRVQPENGGALKIWFDEASTSQIYKFLTDLTATYAVSVSSAQMTRKSSGTVNTTITLQPVGG